MKATLKQILSLPSTLYVLAFDDGIEIRDALVRGTPDEIVSLVGPGAMLSYETGHPYRIVDLLEVTDEGIQVNASVEDFEWLYDRLTTE